MHSLATLNWQLATSSLATLFQTKTASKPSRRSTVPIQNLGKTPKPSSVPPFQADGGGVFDGLENVPLLMHGYATAWAVSLTRLRFIPVAPGSKKWTLRRSTYTVAAAFTFRPVWASTRPT